MAAKETKEQWIAEFRQKRKAALNETYYRKTLEALKKIHLHAGGWIWIFTTIIVVAKKISLC